MWRRWLRTMTHEVIGLFAGIAVLAISARRLSLSHVETPAREYDKQLQSITSFWASVRPQMALLYCHKFVAATP